MEESEKKQIVKSMVESVLRYGFEVWTLNTETKIRLNAVFFNGLLNEDGLLKT